MQMETPPRMWGERNTLSSMGFGLGNTPTYVGRTQNGLCERHGHQKHPHVRGAPPRMWGERNTLSSMGFGLGNTPTYVGRTQNGLCERHGHQKHPHVRGENLFWIEYFALLLETPPRTWGEHRVEIPSFSAIRNTPTYVGRTLTKCFI